MFITKKHLNRRTFLRGSMGAAVALPFLDAMIPAASAASAAPFRFGAVYLPNGVYPDTWHPDKAGSDFVFKPVMQPLEPFRKQLVTVSKMKAPWGESIHLGASSSFLNGIGPVVDPDSKGDAWGKLHSKKTIDQHIADDHYLASTGLVIGAWLTSTELHQGLLDQGTGARLVLGVRFRSYLL